MPRNHNAGPSTLRNRNRVTNKTRLKVISETIDADPIVLDEDEEKARVVSTAGVDAEDANEHHLQAVLSAAATRQQASSRSTRAAVEKDHNTPAAYIPTPDSGGLVDNYEQLYPSQRWKDPATYVRASDTVEESIAFALADGFVYYMDERDQEWLSRNNEEARGEGTSAQGSISGTSTRSGRTTKKGKEPDYSQPVVMSEEEFELVMAIFEKVTQEKTEFLHHGISEGQPFPPFSDYHDTFASQLDPSMFALYTVPSWVPPPAQLLRYAKVTYPYWRERRTERGGHRIIPAVNLDETDTRNESYICFRRREIKAIRKTRAQQATYSDKMVRLQLELSTCLELAKAVVQREECKRDLAAQSQAVWDRRIVLVDMKRKFPALGIREDEELFYDKERVPKKAKTESAGRNIPLKLKKDNGDFASPITHAEPLMRPRDRMAMIQNQIDQDLAKRKEEGRHWEDAVDNAFQPTPVPYTSRLFKIFTSHQGGRSSRKDAPARGARSRVGRGGRIFIDRRILRPALESPSYEDTERDLREKERWRYDSDDMPAVKPDGADEQDRVLEDDFELSQIVHRMGLLSDTDILALSPDFSIPATPEGRLMVLPPKTHQYMMTRGLQALRINAAPTPSPASLHLNGTPHPLQSSGHALLPVSKQMKNMPPPTGVPHVRVSSGGSLRPPTVPNVPPAIQVSLAPSHSSSISAASMNSQQDANSVGVDGIESETKATLQSSPRPVQSQPGTASPPIIDPNTNAAISASLARTKSQTPQPHNVPVPPTHNGYHIASINGFPPPTANGAQYHLLNGRHNAINIHHMQNLKSGLPYAIASPSPDNLMQANANMRATPNYMAHVLPINVNANYAMQLNAARHQWVTGRPQGANGVDTSNVDALMASPNLGTPQRVPSANGIRTQAHSRGMPSPSPHAIAGNPHMARLTPHSSPPHLLSPSLAAAQIQSSPTRSPQTPLATPSPSMQSRQAVGSSGAGY